MSGAAIAAAARELWRAVPRWVWVAVFALILLAVFWWSLMAWGQARFDAGVAAADARWAEASQRLEDRAREAGQVADIKEAERIQEHAAETAAERERLNDAIDRGDSPLDVLFGGV